jgi:hypothetical protein
MKMKNIPARTRKAQMQMNETIFVVFIVIIILVLGLVGYSKFQEDSLRTQGKETRQARVVVLAQSLSSWPELECSEAGTTEFLCFDITKLMVLGNFINQSKQEGKYGFNYYYDLLRDSRIEVYQIYPYVQTPGILGENYWVLYDNPSPNPSTDLVHVPVSLYNPLSRTYALGVMDIQIFE